MIDPKELSISDLLAADHQFVVPEYQRPYSWRSRQIDELIEDLEGYVNRDPGLYLGTIILDTSQKVTKRIYVVDGQQRLTSLFLLLMACRDRARDLNENDMARATQQVITFTDKITLKSVGMRLLASPYVEEAFNAIASSEWKGVFEKSIGKRAIARVKPIYDFFSRSIKMKDANALAEFQAAIYGTRVIRINIDSEEEAFSIFERTNDRGLDLEVADLLKNYFHQHDVPNVKQIWKSIRGNAPMAMPKMLRGFYISRLGAVQKADLYKKLRSYSAKQVGAETLAKQVLEFSEFFALTRNVALTASDVRLYFSNIGLSAISGNQDRYTQAHLSIQALRHFNVTQAQPLIFAALLALRRLNLQSDAATAASFTKLLRSLESFHFVNTSICSRTGNEVEKVYADLCTNFASTVDFKKQVELVLIQLRARLAPLDTFLSFFRQTEYSVKAIPQIAYIFDRLNNANRALGERKDIFFPDENVFRKSLNIEHIWPQKDVGDQKAWPKNLNNIGNLLVVSKQMNSSLGNKSVADKVALFQGKFADRIGEFPTIITVYKTFQKSKEWNDSVILDRANLLAKSAYQDVWKI